KCHTFTQKYIIPSISFFIQRGKQDISATHYNITLLESLFPCNFPIYIRFNLYDILLIYSKLLKILIHLKKWGKGIIRIKLWFKAKISIGLSLRFFFIHIFYYDIK